MRDRRLVSWPDLDRLADHRALWREPSPPPERAEAVRAAIQDSLTPKQRAAVELHYLDGLPEAVAARRLGVSQQVFHKRLHGVERGGRRIGGALARLRAALEGQLP